LKNPKIRLKLLAKLKNQAHRYDRWRVLGHTVSLGIIWAVPLSGLARIDLWNGGHSLLFKPASFEHGLAGVVLGIAALYVVTFLSNVVAGRLFCGWGCPVGQISRFGEDTDRAKGNRAKFVTHLRGAAYSAAFVVGMMAWWVDLRVLGSGQLLPTALVTGLAALGVGLALLHAKVWRWGFCRSACPIGIYYTFVSAAKWYGVNFQNADSSCVECNLCDQVCPVELAPRDLMRPIPARAGISIDDAPGRNHCLECGDCVRACEWMIERRHQGAVPLKLGFYSGEQRVPEKDTKDETQSVA
jgi:ferredoxin-type protein NapH